jgi:hypothetical protein
MRPGLPRCGIFVRASLPAKSLRTSFKAASGLSWARNQQSLQAPVPGRRPDDRGHLRAVAFFKASHNLCVLDTLSSFDLLSTKEHRCTKACLSLQKLPKHVPRKLVRTAPTGAGYLVKLSFLNRRRRHFHSPKHSRRPLHGQGSAHPSITLTCSTFPLAVCAETQPHQTAPRPHSAHRSA